MRKKIMAENLREDIEDFNLAIERMKSQEDECISLEMVMKKYNITEDQLEQLEDVEFE